MKLGARSLVLLILVACNSSSNGSAESPDVGGADVADADADVGSINVDWALDFDPSATAGPLPATLLGQYELSGALYHFDSVPQLPPLLKAAGLSEWRIGLGRWEFTSQLLPKLTDDTPCPPGIPAAFAPAGTTDLDLIKARDWFTYTDGAPVTTPMTADDGRYQLDYVRSVIDVAAKYGALAYVTIDEMPRALAKNTTPTRTGAEITGGVTAACGITFSNKVSNVCPADPSVLGAAVAGMVKRVVEGSGGQPGRPVRHWEFWNEPELDYAWNPHVCAFAPDYFASAAYVLTALDGYRKSTTNADGKAIKIGIGSFAQPSTAAAVLESTTFPAPYDFVSFHLEVDDDPVAAAAKIRMVVDARKGSSHPDAELLVTEWHTSLIGTKLDPHTMDVALHHATLVALAATLGVTHMHHAIFWDYFATDVPNLGFINHDFTPKPAYYAFVMLAQVIGGGASRIAPTGNSDGKLDGGMGAVLASKDASGKVHVLLANPNTVARTATVGAIPTAVSVFDDPTRAPHGVTPSQVVMVPPKSIVVIDR